MRFLRFSSDDQVDDKVAPLQWLTVSSPSDFHLIKEIKEKSMTLYIHVHDYKEEKAALDELEFS